MGWRKTMIASRLGKILIFDKVHENITNIKNDAIKEYEARKDLLPDYHTGYRITLDKSMPVYKELDDIFEKCFSEYIDQYDLNKDNMYSFSDWIVMGWTVPGFGMEIHNDHTNDSTVHGEQHHQPSLTAILYLSHRCEGGNLEFPDLDFAFRPQDATLIIFPSELNHKVSVYLSGERVVSQKFVFIGARESK